MMYDLKITENVQTYFVCDPLFDSILLIFIITVKILSKSRMMLNKKKTKKTCHICYTNAQNAAYLISYLASSFKRIKHVQNGSIENLAILKIDI